MAPRPVINILFRLGVRGRCCDERHCAGTTQLEIFLFFLTVNGKKYKLHKAIMFSRFTRPGAQVAGNLLRRTTLAARGRSATPRRNFSDVTKTMNVSSILTNVTTNGMKKYGGPAIFATFTGGLVILKSIQIIPAGQVGVVDLFGKCIISRNQQLGSVLLSA